jgi:hypothetical protein
LKKDINIKYPLKEDEKSKITVKYDIKTGLIAPLRKDENVGNVRILLDGTVVAHVEYHLPQNIDRKTFNLILLGLLGIIVVSCLLTPFMPHDPLSLKNGYSLIWLHIMYMIGAYLHKYNKKGCLFNIGNLFI